MEYKTKSIETYRVENETAAAALIAKAKADHRCELKKYQTVKKNRKQKGEIVDEWYLVTLEKSWNDEKEPYSSVKVTYSVDNTNIYSMEDEDDDEISE